MDRDWHTHLGQSDACPAQPTRPVEVLRRCGSEQRIDIAAEASWQHTSGDCDIMAWRYAPATKRTALQTQEGGDHYKSMPIQPVEYIHRNGLGFCEGAIVKYVSRWRAKNGIADLRKARHFIDLLIELEASGDD